MPRNPHELNFLEFLQTFRRGDLLAEGDAKLTELVEAIQRTGNGGSFTLKLGFKVNKAGQIEITPDVKLSKPNRALGVGVFYATEDGRLSRRDPQQMDIEDVIHATRGLAAE